MVVDIVPHKEFTEGENAEEAFFLYIPAFLLFQCVAYYREYQRYIYSAGIKGQRINSLDVDVVVLAQEFHQCDVEDYLFVAGADVVMAFLIDHLYRKQEQRGVAWSGAAVRLIPAECPNGEKKRIRTAFLYGVSCGAVYVLQYSFGIVFRKECMKDLMLYVGGYQLMEMLMKLRAHEGRLDRQLYLYIGAWSDPVFAAVLKKVFYSVDIKRYELYGSPAYREVQ